MTAPQDPRYRNPYDDPYRSGNVYGTPQSGPPHQPYGPPASGGGYQPQQPYGQPAYGQPQQPHGAPADGPPGGYPPPKKKSGGKTALIVIGAIAGVCLVLGILGSAFGGGDSTDTAAAPSTAVSEGAQAATSGAPKQDKKTAGLNTPVRDGKFEFTVTSVKCGETNVGTEYLNKTAQGQFCLVAVTVKNIGDQAQTFSDYGQKAFNAGGTEYSADSEAGIYANEDAQTFLEQINPGNSVGGTLVFDIPKGQKITKLELHDSAFSGGVEVTVG